MKEHSLVSIALLTYNHENYIGDCLSSLLDQDYSNMELILLDDASGDQTSKIIESYLEELQKKFISVIFIKNDQNKGNIPFNMNQMLKRAKGTYCKMLSGDDILQYDCISRLTACLEEHPECGIAYANGYLISTNYRKGAFTEHTKTFYSYKRSETDPQNMFRRLMFGNAILAPAVMIKRDLLKRYGYLDESIAYEDYEFWLRLSFHQVRFYYLNENLVYYRKSDSSASSLKSKAGIRNGLISDGKTLKKYYHYLSKEDRIKCKEAYYKRYLKACWEQQYRRGFWGILYRLKREKIPIPVKLLKKKSENEYEQILEKNAIVIGMLERWISNIQEGKRIADYFQRNHYQTIAIYGLGCVANRLCEELKNTEIQIQYIIDQNAHLLLSDQKVIHPDDNFEDVDVVVVTPAGIYETVKEQIEDKITCPIISVEEVLF